MLQSQRSPIGTWNEPTQMCVCRHVISHSFASFRCKRDEDTYSYRDLVTRVSRSTQKSQIYRLKGCSKGTWGVAHKGFTPLRGALHRTLAFRKKGVRVRHEVFSLGCTSKPAKHTATQEKISDSFWGYGAEGGGGLPLGDFRFTFVYQ